MHIDTILVLMFVVATTVAILAKQFRLPYTVALVVAGLFLGQLHAFEPPHLTQELLFAVFLPGLLFEAAFHFDFGLFRRDRSLILTLAVPGVLAGIFLTAAILVPVAAALHLAETLTWTHALVFGALVAATDPIAVVGLFRSLGAPRRLAALLEGESLLNDGTSIVFFGIILAVAGGAAVSASGVVLEFIRVVGIGIGIGFALGLVISVIIQRIDEPMLEITLTTIAAYGAFTGAEHLHGSGVIATVVAGMVCGNYGARTGMSPTTRVAVESFWEYVAFALNSIIFLLIGFEVRIADLVSYLPLILSAFLAVTVGRAAVVFGLAPVAARGADRVPRSWQAILSWGGLRGGLSMVLALSLPAGFPNRALLIATTFGVVILSILVQGLSMAPLLRWLGVAGSHEARIDYDRNRSEMMAVQAALRELDRMALGAQGDPAALATLRTEYRGRLAGVERELDRMRETHADLHDAELLRARRHLLMVEKAEAIEASHQGLLSREAYDRVLADIDARLIQLNDHVAE
ncbi:MAG: sodium:proton antiporter [Gemmatimonadota bacterium]|nr:sodium:proton antiporter [Gemmatimonadota bacterium]MDH4348590.1 sodium:proton antiporter [Gemmatimonadota bacterium]